MIDTSLLRIEAAVEKPFDPRPLLFPKALEAYEDPARHRVWPAGRGSAKTTTAQWALIAAALSVPDVAVIYMVNTAIRAKGIVWPDFLKWNREHRLGGKPHGTDLTITFRNGSRLFVTGADRLDLFERKRGIKRIFMVVLEEAQDWESNTLFHAVTKVFMPRLGDLEKSTGLKGTNHRRRHRHQGGRVLPRARHQAGAGVQLHQELGPVGQPPHRGPERRVLGRVPSGWRQRGEARDAHRLEPGSDPALV